MWISKIKVGDCFHLLSCATGDGGGIGCVRGFLVYARGKVIRGAVGKVTAAVFLVLVARERVRMGQIVVREEVK